MNILLIGNGAREHAMAEAIKRSPQKPVLNTYMKARNPGIVGLSDEVVIGKYDDLEKIRRFAEKIRPAFAVIGPEAPLEHGVVDMLETIGIPSFGPRQKLAELETSKGFTRELMAKYNIRGNPHFQVFTSMDGIKEFVECLDGFVVKPDGLTGGKGVKVQGEHLKNMDDALEYCREILVDHASVIVEEKLVGEEFSLQCITDGKTIVATPPVQDHKRAYADDKGPNTGGMGSYSVQDHLLPFLKKEDVDEGIRITKQCAEAIFQETGQRYKGVMYAGLMVTASGVKLIEYNARFGDPEAMNTFSILKTDFVDICLAVINEELDSLDVEFENKATVCKYAVPNGYPDNPVSDKIIVPDADDVKIYYASVDKRDDGLYMTGSRAIGFVSIADSIDEAERLAENAVSQVKGPVFHREDIGTRKLIQKRIDHMLTIR